MTHKQSMATWWFGFALCVLGVSGCNGKVPTWNELTNNQPPAQQPPQQTTITSPAPEQVVVQPVIQQPVPEKPDPEKIVADFKKLHPGQVTNSAIATLVNLNEGLELVTEIDATGGQVDNAGLGGIHKLTSLKVLRLEGTKVDTKGCESIGQLPALEELTLNGGAIDDEGMIFLKELTNLRILKLDGTRLSSAGWEIIGQYPNLEEIWVVRSSLDDESMAAICEAQTLKVLDIRGTQVSDHGLRSLAKLDNLEHLAIASCPVTCQELTSLVKNKKNSKMRMLDVSETNLNDDGAKAIAGINSLEVLFIYRLKGMTDNHFKVMVKGKKNLRAINFGENSGLTNDALTALSGHKDLETIWMSRNPGINNQGLTALKNLKKLKHIDYNGTGVTAEGIEMLRKSSPDLNAPQTGNG